MIAIAFKHTFSHGVHPPESKELTNALPIRRMPFPAEVVLPLRQHAGKPARVIVKTGQRVERGDVVAESDGFISVPIHASTAGIIKSIALEPHPDGSMSEAVRIAVDPYSAQIARTRSENSPMAAASTKDTASALAVPASSAPQPGPKRVEAIAMP